MFDPECLLINKWCWVSFNVFISHWYLFNAFLPYISPILGQLIVLSLRRNLFRAYTVCHADFLKQSLKSLYNAVIKLGFHFPGNVSYSSLPYISFQCFSSKQHSKLVKDRTSLSDASVSRALLELVFLGRAWLARLSSVTLPCSNSIAVCYSFCLALCLSVCRNSVIILSESLREGLTCVNMHLGPLTLGGLITIS